NELGYIFSDGLHHLWLKKDLYSYLDIAMGKTSRSDYNAITLVAKDRATGALYVVEAWAQKCRPHQALDKVIEFIAKYKPKTFGVETIQAQYEFYRQLQERLNKEGIYGTRVLDMNPKTKKEQRIEALEPLFEQGYIKILKSHRLLKE